MTRRNTETETRVSPPPAGAAEAVSEVILVCHPEGAENLKVFP